MLRTASLAVFLGVAACGGPYNTWVAPIGESGTVSAGSRSAQSASFEIPARVGFYRVTGFGARGPSDAEQKEWNRLAALFSEIGTFGPVSRLLVGEGAQAAGGNAAVRSAAAAQGYTAVLVVRTDPRRGASALLMDVASGAPLFVTEVPRDHRGGGTRARQDREIQALVGQVEQATYTLILRMLKARENSG